MSIFSSIIEDFFDTNPTDHFETRKAVIRGLIKLLHEFENPNSIPDTILKMIHLEIMMKGFEQSLKKEYGISFDNYRNQFAVALSPILEESYSNPTPCIDGSENG